MPLTALRHAAFSARRTYTVGSSVDGKRPDGSDGARSDRAHNDTSSEDLSIALEPHWEASIDAATD
jgi:hypothetical protein